tara:strand:+ start:73 stop:267 length:195 start_codon:yes stop_codon:yes gene_type:complete
MTKYNYLYVLQGNYCYGWEDLTAIDKKEEGAHKSIRQDKKDYQENERGSYRIVSRRELIQEAIT